MKHYLLKKSGTFIFKSILFLNITALFSQVPSQMNHDTKKQPVNVYNSYAINRIVSIDYVAETFEIDFYNQIWWPVDTLALKEKLLSDGLSLKNRMAIDPKYLDWSPNNDFINALSIEKDDSKYLYKDGFVLFDARYKGIFYNDMELRKFPFDDQNLIVLLEDFSKTREELVFKYGSPFNRPETESNTTMIPSEEAFETKLNFSEFRLNPEVKHITSDHTYEFTDDKEVYSQSKLVLSISRETGFYIFKIISITLLIVIMSWIVFFMGVEKIGERSGFSITAFLALVGHNFVTNSILPRIPYLTIMDHITLGASILVFMTAMENLVVYLVYKSNEATIAENKPVKIKASVIDKVSIWMFPSLLILLIVYAYFMLH